MTPYYMTKHANLVKRVADALAHVGPIYHEELAKARALYPDNVAAVRQHVADAIHVYLLEKWIVNEALYRCQVLCDRSNNGPLDTDVTTEVIIQPSVITEVRSATYSPKEGGT